MRSIFIIPLLLLLLVSNSCTLPFFSEKRLDFEPYLKKVPVVSNDYFAVCHLPPHFGAQQILDQATDVWVGIDRWLDIQLPSNTISILAFSSVDPIGKSILKWSRSRHQATGFYDHVHRILVVVGQPGDPRFFTVLRHEAAHGALHNGLSSKLSIPSWLGEGIATLFEQETDNQLVGKEENERLELLQYYLKRGEKPQFRKLISNPGQKDRSGKRYAHAWGLVACLYNQGRPIQQYLLGLTKEGIDHQQLFDQSLLKMNESMESFENSCTDWLLSL